MQWHLKLHHQALQVPQLPVAAMARQQQLMGPVLQGTEEKIRAAKQLQS
jgi:hypothetical protein